MKKIKVLHLITGVDIGGAELLLLNYLKNTKDERFDYSVAYLKGNSFLLKKFQEIGLKVFPLPLISSNIFFRIYKLYKIIKSEEFDILHNHLIHSIIIGRFLGWICRIRIILSTEHNLFEWGYYDYLLKYFYKCTHHIDDVIIAISEAVKDEIVRHTNINPGKIIVIYNGINLDIFQKKTDKIDKFEGYFPVIGCISRLHPAKGQKYLIEAISFLQDKYPRLLLVLVGDGVSKKELVEFSQKLGISSYIRFEGTQNNIVGYLNSFDIFVLPSISEGLSISLIEALAAGKNIIATNVGGIPEVVENMKEGILVSVKNSLAIAESINKILSDDNLALNFRKNAHAKSKSTFDLNVMIETIERLYLDLYFRNSINEKK